MIRERARYDYHNSTPVRTVSTSLRKLFAIMRHDRITQRILASAIGTDQKQISRYRRGAAAPSILRVEEMADAMGYEVVFIRKEVRG